MADNLESYFNKHLLDDTPAEDNWNVPSDKVWESALPEIHKKKGLFIPWRYLYLLGALIIVGAGWGIWALISPGTPTREGAVSDNLLDHQQQEYVLKESKGDESVSVPIEEELKPIVQILINERTNDDKIAEQIEESQFVIEVNSREGMRNMEQLIIIKPKSINQLAMLMDETLHDIHQRDAPELEAIIFEEKKPFNNKSKLGIGAYYAPTFYNTFVSGDVNQGTIETGNSFIYSGNYGAEIKYHITNRLAISTGIARSQVKSWSRSQLDFAYDLSTEHIMPDGEKENASAVPMLTPFGEVDTEITYRFPGEDEIPDGEAMNSVLDTHQDIEYLSIPLGVEYNIIPFSYFNWFAEGGVRFNWASGDATEFSSRIIHNSHDMNVVDEVMTSHLDFKSNYFDFYLGTGLNYQFSKSFLVSGSIRYSRNINKVNVQENLSTNVRAISLKLGFIYFF